MSDIQNTLLIMKPKPSPYQLIRIGRNDDGAYLVPNDLEGIQACYSPGVSNHKGFEDELVLSYGIRCHMCDYSTDIEEIKTPLIENMQTFRKKWLDIDKKDNSISLEEWVNEESRDSDNDLMLQMDIEGAEYRNILDCKDSVLKRFRIIVLEVHQLNMVNDAAQFNQKLGPFLTKLNKNFICVHAHPNNCCGDINYLWTDLNIPNVIELTFLRRDRFEGIDRKKLYEPFIPHPQDINQNVWNMPPLILNKRWSVNDARKFLSRIKIIRIYASYLKNNLKRKIKETIFWKLFFTI